MPTIQLTAQRTIRSNSTASTNTPVAGHTSDDRPSWDHTLSGNGLDHSLGALPTNDVTYDGFNHVGDEGGFSFNDGGSPNNDGGSPNNLLTADGTTSSDTDGFAPFGDAPTNISGPSADITNLGLNADAFQNAAPSAVVPDLGTASSSAAHAIDAIDGAISSINSASGSSLFNDASPQLTAPIPVSEASPEIPAPSSQSAAPVLAWSGDLGSTIGSDAESPGLILGSSAGGGTGTGSSGTGAQTGGPVRVSSSISTGIPVLPTRRADL